MKDLNYYLLQTTNVIPEINIEKNNENNNYIDERENIKYSSRIKNIKKIGNNLGCYIFLIDQSGSMSGKRIELCSKSLLLFLQSLNKGSYFQLIGFGSSFSYYSKEPLEYNKENVKNLMETIKNLKANKGGTDLYKPLHDIFSNSIYDKYEMTKNIFLLTDGEIEDKERTLSLIESYSDKFFLHSLGIGGCDEDLVKRAAIMGKGNSFIINDLSNLNEIVINALEGAQNSQIYNFENNIKDKIYLEYNKKQFGGLNDFIRYGFISKDKNIDDIEIIYKINNGIKNEEKKLNFNKTNCNNNIKILPNGDKLGKIIIYNYFKNSKNIKKDEKIKLSKQFSILSDDTAFYAEIENEEAITEKMVTYKNDTKQALNNDNNKININENDFELNDFGYDKNINTNTEIQKEKKNKNMIGSIFSGFKNLFERKSKIIKKKQFKYQEPKEPFNFSSLIPKFSFRSNKKYLQTRACACPMNFCADEMDGCVTKASCYEDYDYEDCEDYEDNIPNIPTNEYIIEQNNKEKNKPLFDFEEMILSQDIFDGNWSINDNIKLLIEEENTIYEKIKKICEEKAIKEENGIITLFVLYYIYNKRAEKLNELKFVINKAKNFIKNLFGSEYDEIAKDIA